MSAYYNEHDPVAAQWLRNLIAAGHIAPGDVDERSIEDVRPADLVGYAQCHFFAGIGIWSYALRQAGWSDDRPVWTGSCPCQPFSAAGEGAGFADERHLWPAFFHLIRECRPAKILGEQVASKDAEPWIDLVCADLGSLGYASGAIAFPAAGVGAPHIRDRLYWVGDAEREGLEGRIRLTGVSGGSGRADARQAAERADVHTVRMEYSDHERRGEARHSGAGKRPAIGCATGGVADSSSIGWERREGSEEGRQYDGPDAGRLQGDDGPVGIGQAGGGSRRPGPVNGFWRDADWLHCRDERWRPVEPGTFPLAHGAAGRVGRLRAYGNGLCASAARVFIECVMR